MITFFRTPLFKLLFFGIFAVYNQVALQAQSSTPNNTEVISKSVNSPYIPVENAEFALMLKDLLDHSVNPIGVKTAFDLQDEITFLDAREISEFKVSHIKNAQWVGYDDFDLMRVENLEKNSKIVVYCSVGYRSEKVGEKLIEAGYTDVSNLIGSLFEWVNQECPVFSDNQPTTYVHAFDKEWGKWCTKGDKIYK